MNWTLDVYSDDVEIMPEFVWISKLDWLKASLPFLLDLASLCSSFTEIHFVSVN
jgi:hypothetical protein